MQQISATCNSRDNHQAIPQKIILDSRVANVISDCISVSNHRPLKNLKGISFLGEDKYGRSAITLAALTGMKSLIEFLVASGAPMQQTPPIKDFPLLAAVRMKHAHLIPYLLGLQCNVNQKTRDNMTPLFQSIVNNDFDSFSLLLQNGGDPLLETSLGKTPLKEAVCQKNMPMISALIEKGAHPSTKDATLQENAFMVAAKMEFLEGLEYFISLGGVSIDEEDKHGNTTLSYAVMKRNEPLIKWLIEHGADRNHINTRQETPLILACRMLYLNMVKTLVKLDVDVSQIDALVSKMEILEQRRAEKNNRTREPREPRGKEIMQYINMIAQAVDFFFPFRDNSPITYTDIRSAFRDFIQPSQASADGLNILGDPMLIWAVKLGFLEEAEDLLRQNVDIEKKDSKNMTPLLYAIQENNVPMVRLLLRYNAKVSSDTIDFAQQKCWSNEIIELLTAQSCCTS